VLGMVLRLLPTLRNLRARAEHGLVHVRDDVFDAAEPAADTVGKAVAAWCMLQAARCAAEALVAAGLRGVAAAQRLGRRLNLRPPSMPCAASPFLPEWTKTLQPYQVLSVDVSHFFNASVHLLAALRSYRHHGLQRM